MKLRFVYALLTLLIAPSIVHAQPASRPILADYVMWYQPDTFDGSKTFDVPAAGPYLSLIHISEPTRH